jgi:hypothetical protein
VKASNGRFLSLKLNEKRRMAMKVIGIDLGFGYCKVVSAGSHGRGA